MQKHKDCPLCKKTADLDAHFVYLALIKLAKIKGTFPELQADDEEIVKYCNDNFDGMNEIQVHYNLFTEMK